MYLLLSPTALAQTADLSQASLEELMNIKVYSASKYLQDAETAPSLVTVVTAEQIQKYGYRTLADILRGVGGFYVTYDRNYSYVGVRGFGRPGDYNTRILLLLDGHRLNDSVYGLAYVGSEFLLDVDLIERVEVIRGPTSSLFGSNAFFAVINVIPKRGTEYRGAELSTSLASFASYQGRATYGNRFANTDVLLSGTYYTSAGQDLFFPEFNSPQTNYGLAHNADDDRYRSFFGQLAFSNITLRAATSVREKGIPTAAFGTVFNTPATRTFDSQRSFATQYHASFADRGDLTLLGSYGFFSYDGRYVWFDPAVASAVMNADGCRGEWLSTEARLTRSLPRRNKVTVGMEFRNDLRQDQFSFDVQPYVSYLNDHRGSWTWALYAQDEILLSSRFVLNLGFRHDQYSTFGGSSNPRAALIFRPGAATSIKLLYGTAFRAPSAYELYYRGFTFKENPNLRPETIRTFEVVVQQDLNRHLQIAISGYHNKIDKLVEQTIDPADELQVFRNLGNVASRGLEVELSAKWLTGIEGHASYNLQRTTDRANAQVLSNSPLHLAKLGLSVPLARNRLFASFDSWYMSRRRTLAGSSIGGFAIFNATLFSRNLGKHADVSASLYNIFDKNYADPGAEDHIQNALQQDGRTFRLRLAFHF